MLKDIKSIYFSDKPFPIGHNFNSGFSGTIVPNDVKYHKSIKDAIDFKKRLNSHYEVKGKLYLLYVTNKTVTEVKKVV